MPRKASGTEGTPATVLFADAGHRGRQHHESLQLMGVELIVPGRHKLGQRPESKRVKARARLVINTLLGRPPRALAAYYGR